jgi:hypothetical protein
MVTSVIAELPALPLHEAGKYVAGAYVVLFVVVLIYVAIMAIRLSRIERALGELLELTEQPDAITGPPASPRHEPSEPESTPAYPIEGQT